MKFIQHYSSSSGNLYEVVGGGRIPRRLLLECGVRWKQILKALCFNISRIDGCLVTHEHKDHCKAAEKVIEAGIDIYSSEGTFSKLMLTESRRVICVEAGYNFRPCDVFSVIPFGIRHDAAEPFGFLVRDLDSSDTLLFAPDNGFIEQKWDIQFTHIAMECSYDAEILQYNIKKEYLPLVLGKRLQNTHTSTEVAKRYLDKFTDLTKCREIHLLHCSEGNLDKERTRKEFEDRYFCKVIVK